MTAVATNKHCFPQFILVAALWLVFGLTGCATFSPTDSPTDSPTESVPSEEVDSSDRQSEPDEYTDRADDLDYNLSKLDDPEFTQTYGDGENEKIWYTAAENLGSIGKPAIPHLIAKLDSDSEHEVMLALYALQLASQDPALQRQTDGNYIALPSVLNPRANRHNRAIALSWWEQFQYLWDESYL